jgi:hypothetical protein
MKLFSVKRVLLAAAVFSFGILGSVEWSQTDGAPEGFVRGDFTVTVSGASAGEASGRVRRISCALVRFYVDKYSASAAEAWARNKGATDADIQTARRCITPQQTAQVRDATNRAF